MVERRLCSKTRNDVEKLLQQTHSVMAGILSIATRHETVLWSYKSVSIYELPHDFMTILLCSVNAVRLAHGIVLLHRRFKEDDAVTYLAAGKLILASRAYEEKHVMPSLRALKQGYQMYMKDAAILQ